MRDADLFLKIAKTDFQAAKCLYKQALYPQAIFNLQQSVEKLTKAFGSLSADMSLDVMKKEIGHIPFGIFIYSLQQFANSFIAKSSSAPSSKACDEIQDKSGFLAEVQKVEQVYKSLEKIPALSALVLKSQLPQILNQIHNSQDKDILDSDMEEFLISIECFLKKQSDKMGSVDVDSVCAMLRKYMQDIIKIMIPLAFLVLILPSSCVQDTRYPMDKSNPLELYTAVHPLIKSFSDVMEVCDFVFEYMPDVFKMFDEFEKLGEKVQR